MARALAAFSLTLIAAACSPASSSEVLVGSASSFAHVLEAARESYQDHDLQVLVGGSQLLVTQVLDDAPIDVVITADWPTMATLATAGRTRTEPTLLSRNAIVIGVEQDNPLALQSISDLARSDLKVVLADAEVPLGSYSAAILEAAGVDVSPVSMANSATAVAGLLASGEADAGLVYRTDADLWGLTQLPLPGDSGLVAEYYIASLTGAPNPQGAAALVEFLLGGAGQKLLAGWGFTR